MKDIPGSTNIHGTTICHTYISTYGPNIQNHFYGARISNEGIKRKRALLETKIQKLEMEWELEKETQAEKLAMTKKDC